MIVIALACNDIHFFTLQVNFEKINLRLAAPALVLETRSGTFLFQESTDYINIV